MQSLHFSFPSGGRGPRPVLYELAHTAGLPRTKGREAVSRGGFIPGRQYPAMLSTRRQGRTYIGGAVTIHLDKRLSSPLIQLFSRGGRRQRGAQGPGPGAEDTLGRPKKRAVAP